MDCFLKGLCGQNTNTEKLHTQLEDPLLAPFVVVKIQKDAGSTAIAIMADFANLLTKVFTGQNLFQDSIGVGNSSQPAVIKSFQYGLSTGCGCEIEIVDEEAGDFSAILSKINVGGSATGNFLSVRFGWISSDCNGKITPPPNPQTVNPLAPEPSYSSPELLFVIEKITLSYQGGLVKYTITCIDMLQVLQHEKVGGVFGSSTTPMSLTDAIRDLLKDRTLQVQYLKFNSATTSGPLEFDMTGDGSAGGTGGAALGVIGGGLALGAARTTDAGRAARINGPVRKWSGSYRNVLECILSWCSEVMTNDKKGLRLFYEPSKPPRLIVMADIPDHCKATWTPTNFSLGTYIVNGGDCGSPVIRFQPTIQWYTSSTAFSVGGSGGGKEAGLVSNKGPADCLANMAKSPELYGPNNAKMSIGDVLQLVLSEGEVESRLNAALRYSYNAKYVNNLANIIFGGGITAEMTVQGDPSFSMPVLLIGRYLNLIVINPYRVGTSCQWQNSVKKCNDVLSNSNWMIMGVSHSIQAGSFTTTFKLMMTAPGQDTQIQAPLGQEPKKVG